MQPFTVNRYHSRKENHALHVVLTHKVTAQLVSLLIFSLHSSKKCCSHIKCYSDQAVFENECY